MNLAIAEFFSVNQVDVSYVSAFPSFDYPEFSRDNFARFCRRFFPGNTVFQAGILERMYIVIRNSLTRAEFASVAVDRQIRLFFVYWSRLLRAGPLRKCKIFVDLQNDFVTGSLSLPRQESLNRHRFLNLYAQLRRSLCTASDADDLVVLTRDWHPEKHVSFFDNCHLYRPCRDSSQPGPSIYQPCPLVTPYCDHYEQVLWPTHCVQDTVGADFTPHARAIMAESRKLFPFVSVFVDPCSKILVNPNKYIVVDKGSDVFVDSYSAFFDALSVNRTALLDQLLSSNIYSVEIYGVCLEFCVKYTAQDATKLGFSTTVVESACPVLYPLPEKINLLIDELKRTNINIARQ